MQNNLERVYTVATVMFMTSWSNFTFSNGGGMSEFMMGTTLRET